MRHPPRHLADEEAPARGTGLLLAGLLLLAGVGVVLVLRANGSTEGQAAPDGPGPSLPATSAPPRPSAAATASTSGEALASAVEGGGFETGLAGLEAAEGTSLRRVAGGQSSAWAAELRTTAGAPAPVEVSLERVVAASRGAVYAASVWVRASRPGVIAEIKLSETQGGRSASADAGLIVLDDTRWHQIGVRHEVAASGSVLGLEIEASALAPGQTLLLDHLELVRAV